MNNSTGRQVYAPLRIAMQHIRVLVLCVRMFRKRLLRESASARHGLDSRSTTPVERDSGLYCRNIKRDFQLRERLASKLGI